MTAWYEETLNALTRPLSPQRRESLAALIEAWDGLEPRPTLQEIQEFVLPVLRTYKGEGDGEWRQAMPGFLALNDIVRIRKDAYDNGVFADIEARVVGIRRGFVFLKALNPEDSIIENYSFRVNQLDKRVAH